VNIAATLLVCLLGLAVNALAWSSWTPMFILNDGVQYLSTAYNWLEGHGFSTNALMFTPHFQSIIPAPQTVWPPGYPLLIALTSKLGVNIQQAALLLNLFFQAVSAILVLLILLRSNLKLFLALLYTLIFYFTAIPWMYALGLATEPLFTALILAALVLVPNPEQDRIWHWIASGVFIALCVAVRYSGVFFALGVGLGTVLYMLVTFRTDSKRLMRGFGFLTLQLSIPVVLFGALQYRNYLLTGTLSRETGSKEQETLLIVIKKIAWQARELIGFTDGGILPGFANRVLFVVFVLLLIYVILHAVYVIFNVKNKAVEIDNGHHVLLKYVIVGHSVVFLIFFTISSLGTIPVDLTHRYLYQIYPGLFILICLLISKCFKYMAQKNNSGMNRSFRGSIGALLCLFVIAQLNFVSDMQSYQNAGRHSREVMAVQVTQNIELQNMITSCFNDANTSTGSLWSNDAQLLHLNSLRPTISIAESYAFQAYDINMIEEQIRTYDIKMFIFLNDLPDVNPHYVKLLSELKQWLQQAGHAKVPMLENRISDGISVDAYVVDQNCLTFI